MEVSLSGVEINSPAARPKDAKPKATPKKQRSGTTTPQAASPIEPPLIVLSPESPKILELVYTSEPVTGPSLMAVTPPARRKETPVKVRTPTKKTPVKGETSPLPKFLAEPPLFKQAPGKPGFVSMTPIPRPYSSPLEKPRPPVQFQMAGSSKTECTTIMVLGEEVNECTCPLGRYSLLVLDTKKLYMFHIGCSGYHRYDRSKCHENVTRMVTHDEFFLRLFYSTQEIRKKYTKFFDF